MLIFSDFVKAINQLGKAMDAAIKDATAGVKILTFYEKYQFQWLTRDAVARLRGFGLSENQVMGAEKYINSLYVIVSPQASATLDRLATSSSKEEIMQERAFLQKKYEQFGVLPLTEVGELFVKGQVEEAAALMREREAAKEVERLRLLEVEKQAFEEEGHMKVIRKTNLKSIRDLPEDFTLDDL